MGCGKTTRPTDYLIKMAGENWIVMTAKPPKHDETYTYSGATLAGNGEYSC